MKRRISVPLISLCSLLVLVIVWQVLMSGSEEDAGRSTANRPVPVEVATIEHGRIELHRLFSGTLESMVRCLCRTRNVRLGNSCKLFECYSLQRCND